MMLHTLVCALLASTAMAAPAPAPQGVTEAITPGTQAPANCQPSWEGVFGMTVMNYTGGATTGQSSTGNQTSQIADGQVQGTNQIADGQVQNQPATNQIADGQVQQQQATKQIADGQVQQPTNQIADGQVQQQQPTNQIADGQVQQQQPTKQIADGQVQQPTNQIADGQVQQQQPTNQIADGQVQQQQPTNQIADGQVQQQQQPTNQIGDGQVQQQATNQIGDGQVQQQQQGGSSGSSGNSTMSGIMSGCKKSDSLTLTLQDGILKDGQGRIGYIASNRQFQFDGPPQAGALVTAGWSVCTDKGVLALGEQTVFYQCLSGTFYNLYDKTQGEQCNEVTFNVLNFTC